MRLPRLDSVPVWIWGAGLAAAGVVFLTWHKYARDDEDESWLRVEQPPAMVAMPLTPALPPGHGCGPPMACCTPSVKSRSYPANLRQSEASIIGDF